MIFILCSMSWFSTVSSLSDYCPDSLCFQHSLHFVLNLYVLCVLSFFSWAGRGDGLRDGSPPFSQAEWRLNKTSFLSHQHLPHKCGFPSRRQLNLSFSATSTPGHLCLIQSVSHLTTLQPTGQIINLSATNNRKRNNKGKGGRRKRNEITNTQIHTQIKTRKNAWLLVFISVTGQNISTTSFFNCCTGYKFALIQHLNWSRFCVCVFSLVGGGVNQTFILKG